MRARTPFYASRLTPRSWFRAIFLATVDHLTQYKNNFSALSGRCHQEVSCRIAWRSKHRLQKTLVECKCKVHPRLCSLVLVGR